ncbi:hypothetical protein JOH51_000854 [Rhizobium leguminosarum]|nr:hypothetical protein [Rhizobium leguminosarum]
MKAKLVRANGGAPASALAYDSWEEFYGHDQFH